MIVRMIDPMMDERWDKFVSNHPYGWICHLSAWKRVLQSCFQHLKGHYFVIEDEQTEKIHAGLPIFDVRSWLTGSRMVSVPFSTFGDPLVSNTTQFELLVDAIEALAFEHNSDYVEIRSLKATPFMNRDLHPNTAYLYHYIDLNEGLDAVWRRFHAKAVRHRIKRAAKNGLTLKLGDSEADLAAFYNLYVHARKRLSLPPQPYCFFKAIWREFFDSGRISLLLAEREGKLLSAIMMFKFGKRTSADYLVWDRDQAVYCPSHFIQWEAIKFAYAEGYETYDLGRTHVSNQALLNHKKQWGVQTQHLPYYFMGNGIDPGLSTHSGYARWVVDKVSRVTPEFLYPALGSACYKHMG